MNAAETVSVDRYRQESWRLLAQVDVELERGNVAAASQALWDAAAHGLKAVAARRGWPHGSVNEQLYVVIPLIKEEGGPVDLNTNAIIAHSFNRRERAWEIPLLESEVRYGREPVAELLKTLESMG